MGFLYLADIALHIPLGSHELRWIQACKNVGLRGRVDLGSQQHFRLVGVRLGNARELGDASSQSTLFVKQRLMSCLQSRGMVHL